MRSGRPLRTIVKMKQRRGVFNSESAPAPVIAPKRNQSLSAAKSHKPVVKPRVILPKKRKVTEPVPNQTFDVEKENEEDEGELISDIEPEAFNGSIRSLNQVAQNKQLTNESSNKKRRTTDAGAPPSLESPPLQSKRNTTYRVASPYSEDEYSPQRKTHETSRRTKSASVSKAKGRATATQKSKLPIRVKGGTKPSTVRKALLQADSPKKQDTVEATNTNATCSQVSSLRQMTPFPKNDATYISVSPSKRIYEQMTPRKSVKNSINKPNISLLEKLDAALGSDSEESVTLSTEHSNSSQSASPTKAKASQPAVVSPAKKKTPVVSPAKAPSPKKKALAVLRPKPPAKKRAPAVTFPKKKQRASAASPAKRTSKENLPAASPPKRTSKENLPAASPEKRTSKENLPGASPAKRTPKKNPAASPAKRTSNENLPAASPAKRTPKKNPAASPAKRTSKENLPAASPAKRTPKKKPSFPQDQSNKSTKANKHVLPQSQRRKRKHPKYSESAAESRPSKSKTYRNISISQSISRTKSSPLQHVSMSQQRQHSNVSSSIRLGKSQRPSFFDQIANRAGNDVGDKNEFSEGNPIADRYVGNDVFGNYFMMRSNDVVKTLNQVRPDHGLDAENVELLSIRVNHWLEDFFVHHCNETQHPYGFIPFSQLKQGLIDQCLLDEDATNVDLIKKMKDIFSKEDWRRSEDILFPSRYDKTEDTYC